MSQLEGVNRKAGLSVMSVNAAPFVPRMSPTAAPFVPRSFSMKVSAIEKPVTLSASAEEFVPRIFRNIQQDGWIDYENPVVEVAHMLRMLTVNPQEFDVIVGSLIDLVSQYVDDLTIMTDIVEELINRMLLEPGFRCSGAKICRYLIERIDGLSTENFEQLLLTKCLSHYGNLTTITADSDEGVSSLTTFALLLADIIINDAGNITTDLAQVLKEMMLILLAQGTDDALECVAHVLKLASGLFYERGIDIDTVLSMVMNIIQSSVSSKYLQDLLKNALPESWRTVNLSARSRASNYGIDLEQNHYNQFVSDDEKDVTTRIGRLNCTEDLDNNKVERTDDHVADEGEMDPEIEAAFDQFLRDVDDTVISPTGVKFNYIPELSHSHSTSSASQSYDSQLLAGVDARPPMMFAYYSSSGDVANPMPYFEGQVADVSPQFGHSPVSHGLSPSSHYFNGQVRQFGVNPYASSPVGASMFPLAVAATPWSMIAAQYPYCAPPASTHYSTCTKAERDQEEERQESIAYNEDSYDDRHGSLFYNNSQLTTNVCGPQSWWN